MAENRDLRELQSYWLQQIKDAQKRDEPWHKRCEDVLKRFRGDDLGKSSTRRLNIYWANIKTLQPALYSKRPKPYVTRRHGFEDAITRIAAQIAERAVTTAMDDAYYDESLRSARDDYLHTSRGVCWVRYEAQYGDAVAKRNFLKPASGGGEMFLAPGGGLIPRAEVKFDQDDVPYIEDPGETYEPHVGSKVCVDFVLFRDFVHGVAPHWDAVPWAARRSFMGRKELIKRFGERGQSVKLRNADDKANPADRAFEGTAPVWEIWDKRGNEVLWVTDTEQTPLDFMPPPLRLRGFFPCPRPVYGTTTPDRMEPVPDYCIYQDQIAEIDDLTARIADIVQGIRVTGMYDSRFPELGHVLVKDGNSMIPMNNFAAFAQAGGIDGATVFIPLDQSVNALNALVGARKLAKDDLYEVTGLSDIIRGQSVASETATAQQIKGQWATLRLKERQEDFARFAKDVIELMTEVILEHYPVEHVLDAAGLTPEQRVAPEVTQALQVLKSDRMRTFRIDIETDATIAADENQEKQNRIEFLSMMTPFLKEAVTAGMQVPQLVPLIGESILFGVRGFRAGREMEERFEQAVEDLKQSAQQAMNAPPAPDPKVEAEAAKAEAAMQKTQAEMQALQQKTQAELQAKQGEMALKAQSAQQDMRLRQAGAVVDAQIKMQQAAMRPTPQ